MPALSIWVGTTLSSLLIVLGSGIAVAGPAALLLGAKAMRQAMPLSGPLGDMAIPYAAHPLVLMALPVIVFLVARAVAVTLADRSPLLLLDVAAAAACAGLLWKGVSDLFAVQARRDLAQGLAPAAPALLMALVLGGAAAVIWGRADRRRAHRALTLTLWPLALVAAFGFVRYSAWVLAPRPSDITEVYRADVAPQGPWIAVGGLAKGRIDYKPALLVNTDTGRHYSIGPLMGSDLPSVMFAADGSEVFWVESIKGRGGQDNMLMQRSLANPSEPPRQAVWIGHQAGQPWSPWMTLAPDGSAMATVLNRTIHVFRTADGRCVSLASQAADASWWRLSFTSPDTLRAAWWTMDKGDGMSTLHLGVLPVGSQTLQETGSIAGLRTYVANAQFDPTWKTALIRNSEDGPWWLNLYDGISGTRIAAVDSGPAGTKAPSALMLANGQIARVIINQGKVEVLVGGISEFGYAIPLGPGSYVRLAEEVTPGIVLASVSSVEQEKIHGTTYLVDITGRNARVLREGAWVPPEYWRSAPGTSATPRLCLLTDEETERLLVVDPVTGQVRMTIGG
jgi:hypothetical protein